ncbi:DEAD/DEAH box helicase family protein [Halobacillus shinanisalinarum]|uniref:DEAD/DEAH box helicase family protein n=1 Tax=Halobacillus shinanisalinarum TaxID=2932258 RepID=A0ABY4H1T8_9BACI|nr:helicase-related protein [Halobacillus shinanisalinarum]UOQ94405.1 DEAD/DEAH box helicase family protein [Halobacillus shinanisalinarum]
MPQLVSTRKNSSPSPPGTLQIIPEQAPHKWITGKLLTRQEIPLLDEEFTALVTEGQVQKVLSIEKQRSGYVCRRCGNDKSYLFAAMPHLACQKECVYCRNCIMMGRVLECEPLYLGSPHYPWPAIEELCAWEGELTSSQKRAADEIVATISKGNSELLVYAVCGAGKTEMLFPGIAAALKHGQRVCIATPRTDVVRELAPRLKLAFPIVSIQALYGDSEEKLGDAQLLLSTTHQLYRFAYAFDVMIIDEIDAFPYHNDSSLQFASERAAKHDASLVYLTATPRAKEKKRIKRKQLPAVFIPKRFHGYPLPVPQLKLSPLLRKKLASQTLPQPIFQLIRSQQLGGRQLLLFTSTIEYAHLVTDILKPMYPEITSVHAEDPEREEKVRAFRDQAYRILVTTTILERGVTFPSVDVYVLDAGHVVFDEAALVQIAGRAGRSHEDPTGDVFFFHIGKTNAMLDAQEAIIKMNRLGQQS